MRYSKSTLGDLEQAIMDHLWDHEPSQAAGFTVRDVHEALADVRDLAYTTVMTVMDRLARKDFLTRTKHGRAYVYQAALSRDALAARTMSETLGPLRPTDRRAAVLAFVDDARSEDVAALREALTQLEDAGD